MADIPGIMKNRDLNYTQAAEIMFLTFCQVLYKTGKDTKRIIQRELKQLLSNRQNKTTQTESERLILKNGGKKNPQNGLEIQTGRKKR